MIFLRGRELAAIVPTCGTVAGAAANAAHTSSVLRSNSSRVNAEAQQPQ
jgi:hypothetical protein